MPDASPTKWHRAHVTWFFEEFLLRKFAPSYPPFDERFAYLFNSYYVSAGPRHARPQRGLITRPGAAEVTAYRAHVDDAVAALIQSANDLAPLIAVIEIGLNHEQQHQELMLTDILHAFSLNATHPAYDPQWQWPQPEAKAPRRARCSPAFTRSVTPAAASASTMRSRRIRCCCSRCGCRRGS